MGERNEASESILSDTSLSKTPKDIKANRASKPEGDDQNSAPDLTLSPYDPLTNYLSPRPKFLRYNPNRRQEIFLRNENKNKDGKDRFSVSQSVSFESQNASDEGGGDDDDDAFASQGGIVQPEDEEIVEDDEEIEEERGWCLRGVLKTLIVFFILVLSTSYISSMNFPTASPAMEAIEGLRLKIQNHTFGAMEGVQFGCLKIKSLVFGGNSMLISVVEDEDEVVELQQVGQDEDVPEEKMAENSRIQEKTAEEFEAFQDNLIQTLEPVVSEKDVNTDSISMEGKIEDSVGGWAGNEGMVVDEDITEQEDEDVPDKKMVENFGIQNEKNVSFQYNLIQTLEPVVSEKVGSTDSISKQGKVEEVSVEGGAGNEEMAVDDITEPEGKLKLEITEHVIWASAFSIIVAAMVLGFSIRRRKTLKTLTPTIVNQCTSASLAAEKSSVVMAAPSNEGEDQSEKAESYYANLSVQEASQEEFSQSRAPSVELLGEFVAGEISSTPKIHSMKSRMTTESEKSNHISLSQALSSMDSASYGSFTAEKSTRKKKEVRAQGLV